MRFLLLLFLAWGAFAGEIGLRVEAPENAWVWMAQDWELSGLTGSSRVEMGLLPLGFRRGTLGLSWATGLGAWKAEGILLSSGRIDLLFSSTLSQSFALPLGDVQAAVGGKWGWAAVNMAPTWVGGGWLLFQLAMGRWTTKLELEGPPVAAGLSIEGPGVSFSVGSALALTLSQTRGDLSLSAQIQITPRKTGKITAVWAGLNGTLQAWLGLGGAGLVLSHSLGNLNVLFFLSFDQKPSGFLEVTRNF